MLAPILAFTADEAWKSVPGKNANSVWVEMQTMQFFCYDPAIFDSFICIASTMRHSAQQIAFNEVGRRAIMADPRWNGGNYYDEVPPEGGLSVARMIGHITYISEKMMQEKFGRLRKGKDSKAVFRPSFEVEHYLDYQGISFCPQVRCKQLPLHYHSHRQL